VLKIAEMSSHKKQPISGQEAVVVKNGSRLCGTGCARATTPILQNKAYWEIKLQQSGIWSCGVSPDMFFIIKRVPEAGS
jgi:hypothetical protein